MKTFRALFLALCCSLATTVAIAQQVNVVVTLAGHVLNANTLQPVEASYSVYDAAGKKVGITNKANPIDGYLVTGLKPGENYTVRIEDPRYFKQEYAISIPKTSKYVEISKDFTVKPMAAGRKFPVQPSVFELRKSTLKVGADGIMKDVSDLLRMNPGVKVDVVCYADESGAADGARKVSTDRGNAIKNFLVQSGVTADRVNVNAQTTTDPINPPPVRKGAKGKRYVGSVYIVVTGV